MRTIVFYKPYGVLSSFTDSEGRPTIHQFVPVADVYAAGRLDLKSEGLLLLTDDGGLIHKLTHPRYEHPKVYVAQLEGLITQEAVQQLQNGVIISGYETKPAQAEIISEPELPPRPVPVRDYHPTSWLKIVLREGKKHQVRKMTAAVGFPTLRLVRIAIGPLNLGNLKPGEWRYLTISEIKQLKNLSE
jgi:23S rRNA pseudouridine2457 synthase